MKPTIMHFFQTLIVAMVLVSVFAGITVTPTSAARTVANTMDTADATLVLYAAQGGLISGECSSWAAACELRYVLPLADVGEEIWVKAGTYRPTNSTTREIAFQLKAGVAVYGGFAGTETDRTERDPEVNITILSGDLNGDDGANFANNGENSYHVVVGATDATLDGVTISGGNANASNPFDRGGGILNNGANPTLANLIIRDNAATVGAGIYNDASSPTLTDVIFSGNVASKYGGGMRNSSNSNPTLNHVTFSSNSAENGGGMFNNASSPTLMDVSFISNRATTQYGGGMQNESNSNPILTNVTFKSNTAINHGGGMFNTASSPTLTNVTFWNNSTSTQQESWGGGMANWNGSSPILTNVTFSGNVTYWASGGGGGMVNFTNSRPQIRNSIFWGNTGMNGPNIFNGSASEAPIITDSVIPGCPTHSTCTGIITTEPRLASLGSFGGETQTMPLLPGSSAINASTANCPATDQRGIVRSAPLCDAGAFESRGFTLAIHAGNPQSTGINTGFATPLSVLVSSAHGEPVSGGSVTFTPPASGASTTLSGSPATIAANGIASVTAVANGTVGGPYAVRASAKGANDYNFSLTNLQTYTVTYHGNGNTGGSVPVDSNSPYVEGESVTVRGNTGTLIRTGHTFSGWNLQSNGQGFGYAPTTTFLMPSANVILYAQWTMNSYTVTFDSQSDSAVPSQSVNYGGLVTRPTDPTRTGYTFAGWYTAASGGTLWNFASSTVTANTTLYARWTLNSYTVTFDSQCDATIPEQTVNHGGLVSQPADPAHAGYTFNGWYTAASGGTLWNFDSSAVTASITLYAQWTDSDLPIVTTFAATSLVNEYSIPITSFSATDNEAITGYLITESSTPPLAHDDGWADTAPTTYTVTENGMYTLYPWAKDAVGNVSPVYDSPATVTVQENLTMFSYLPFVMR
ncbi:MAG TPA: InlB B-repeat-containing protein [Anaerolineaceae bacterium]|nr:InlB B-repeat-containing protein [Anaerolineaceae bacterium]